MKNELAKSYYQNGEFSKAITIYDSMLLIEPNNLRALFNKGLSLTGDKKFVEADKIFRKANEADPMELENIKSQSLILKKAFQEI